MDLEERHILAAMREGNRDAFEKMFRTWYSPLCSFARSFLASNDEAEETVQQVMIQIWEKREVLVIEISLKSYLFRAVRNASLNVLKHEKVKLEYVAFATMDNASPLHEAVDNMAMEELNELVSKSLLKLPEQCRIIFKLSRFEEMKYAEIAAHLNLSIKTVENQMGKALRIMREEMSEYLNTWLILFCVVVQSVYEWMICYF